MFYQYNTEEKNVNLVFIIFDLFLSYSNSTFKRLKTNEFSKWIIYYIEVSVGF